MHIHLFSISYKNFFRAVHYLTEVSAVKPEFRNVYRLMGLNIAYYRNLNEMSQEQLGDLLGFDQSHISKIERASAGISMDTLCAIAQVLHVQPYQLLKPKD